MKYILSVLMLLSFHFSTGQQLDPGILLARNTSTFQENAIQFYSEIIERNPKDVRSIMLRAELHRALNNEEAAIADFNLAMSINPYSYLYLNQKERKNFFTRRNYSYFNPENINFDMNFDKTFILEKTYDKEMIANRFSAKSETLMKYVLIALEMQHFEEAEMLMDAVSEEDKDNALFYDIQGVIAMDKGYVEDGLEYFNKAIEIDPQFTVAYHNRAVAHKLLGNFEASKADFSKALKQRADIAQIQFGKANLLEKMGDLDGARHYYESAIANNEDYVEARLNYSVLLKSIGEYNRALFEINELIDEYPDNIGNYYVRGGLYFIYGEYEKAVKDFNYYLTENPDDADVFFYRGISLVLDGKPDRGCNDISISIEKGYDNFDDVYLFMCE